MMIRIRKSSVLLWLMTMASLTGCLQQYNPEPYRSKWEQERKMASTPQPKLTEKGEWPKAEAAGAVSIEKRFEALCSSCHGATGGGDGPAGVALNPKPRNFHDAAWQAATSDERITHVITKGGPAEGLSPLMAPFGGVLSPEEITAMAAYVRKLGGK